MNLLICSESHYAQVGTDIYCPQTPPDYFQRYREVWDKVVLLGRLAICSQVPSGAPLLNLEGIEVVGLPDYRGPIQYWLHRRRIRKIARDTLARVDGILFRGAHQISSVVYSLIHRECRPYGVEVVGDPYDSMAPGATSHPLRAFFRWKFVQNQKRICRDAFASAYVTSAALQRRYRPSPGKFTIGFSDVVIKPVSALREQFPSQGPYRLIAIGTLATMYKGHDVLLQAVARTIGAGLDLQLVIIGDGQLLPRMKQLAQALGIGDRVTFRGLVPFGDPIFAELDGCIFSSCRPVKRVCRGRWWRLWRELCLALALRWEEFRSCLTHPS